MTSSRLTSSCERKEGKMNAFFTLLHPVRERTFGPSAIARTTSSVDSLQTVLNIAMSPFKPTCDCRMRRLAAAIFLSMVHFWTDVAPVAVAWTRSADAIRIG